jgi:hypothetical protein
MLVVAMELLLVVRLEALVVLAVAPKEMVVELVGLELLVKGLLEETLLEELTLAVVAEVEHHK